MTEVELYTVTAAQLEVVAAFMGNYATHVGIYLTLVFGYCVAAYAAGPGMSRFQVLVATELQAVLMSTWVSASRELMMQLETINPAIQAPDRTRWQQLLGILTWQAGILAAVAFMWSVMHRAVAQPEEPL